MSMEVEAKIKELHAEHERFTGMPTLEYDEILQSIEEEILELEPLVFRTCPGCGGEHANLETHFTIPENGNCAGELPECWWDIELVVKGKIKAMLKLPRARFEHLEDAIAYVKEVSQ